MKQKYLEFKKWEDKSNILWHILIFVANSIIIHSYITIVN